MENIYYDINGKCYAIERQNLDTFQWECREITEFATQDGRYSVLSHKVTFINKLYTPMVFNLLESIIKKIDEMILLRDKLPNQIKLEESFNQVINELKVMYDITKENKCI
jgi:hypothetical protein